MALDEARLTLEGFAKVLQHQVLQITLSLSDNIMYMSTQIPWSDIIATSDCVFVGAANEQIAGPTCVIKNCTSMIYTLTLLI